MTERWGTGFAARPAGVPDAAGHLAARSVGRPRTFDTAEVVDRALEVFWRHGFHVTTTRDLEAALGLSASSIYNAFGSKEALLLAALDGYERRITREVLEPLESSPRGLDAIDGFFKSLGHWIAHEGKRGCMLVNLMAEDGDATTAITSRVRRYRRRLRLALRAALRKAAGAGEFSPVDVEPRVDLLVCLVFGLNIAARGGARPVELQRLVGAARRQIAAWRT